MLTEEQSNWINELRTTDKEQGKSYLCRDNKYCCLGIYADMVGELQDIKDAKYVVDSTGTLSDVCLSRDLVKRLGLHSSEGKFIMTATMREHLEDIGVRVFTERDYCLTMLNDVDKLTFKQIADFCEKFAEDIFVQEK